MTAAEFVAELREWLETPWVHQQACKGKAGGADCIGSLAGAAANVGSANARRFLANKAWRAYGRHPDPPTLFALCDELMVRVEPMPAEPAAGDVMIFNSGKHPMHFGVATGEGTMLHCWLVARRMVEHQLDALWRARIVRVYRLQELA